MYLDVVLHNLPWVSLLEQGLDQVDSIGPCPPQTFCDPVVIPCWLVRTGQKAFPWGTGEGGGRGIGKECMCLGLAPGHSQEGHLAGPHAPVMAAPPKHLKGLLCDVFRCHDSTRWSLRAPQLCVPAE